MAKYKLSELTATAYTDAIKAARREIAEAFHFKIQKDNYRLIEEVSDDLFLRFDANGNMVN